MLSTICIKYGSKDGNIFKEEESIEILKIIDLINNIEKYQKINLTAQNISQEFRLKEIDEIRNYFIEDINRNELISKKHKKIYKILNHTEHLLILVSTVTGCASISTFALLVGSFVGMASSATTIKIGVITAVIKKYTSIIKKKRKNMIK